MKYIKNNLIKFVLITRFIDELKYDFRKMIKRNYFITINLIINFDIKLIYEILKTIM